MKSKLSGANKIAAINSSVVSVVRYCVGIIEWTKRELCHLIERLEKW